MNNPLAWQVERDRSLAKVNARLADHIVVTNNKLQFPKKLVLAALTE